MRIIARQGGITEQQFQLFGAIAIGLFSFGLTAFVASSFFSAASVVSAWAAEISRKLKLTAIFLLSCGCGFISVVAETVSLSCSGSENFSALSASVKESYKAKDALKDLYPNQKIQCVDSANCTFSLAMILKEAGKMRDAGKPMEEIIDWIDENKLYFNEVGTVDKLTYLRLAGRVSASAAFFGGMLGVKPIVVYDMEGHNVAVQKVKGRKKSLETVADYIKKYAITGIYNTIYIAHADCLEDAQLLAQMIQERFTQKLEFVFDYIESGVGSSVGPGTLILGFYGNKAIRMLNE